MHGSLASRHYLNNQGSINLADSRYNSILGAPEAPKQPINTSANMNETSIDSLDNSMRSYYSESDEDSLKQRNQAD